MVLLLLLVCFARLGVGFSATDPQDVAALRSLMGQWKNSPPSWGQSDDPCGAPWEGVVCSDSRVTALKLSTMSIHGSLSGDISQLSQLQSLDLSYNSGLGGPLTPSIGKLKQLSTLILAGCSFTGSIPQVLGSLPLLSFLALNSNQFSGRIPASLGNLNNLYWLDIAENQLSGKIPVSSGTTPGLDLLVNAKHFHFSKNQLSGSIPPSLFSSKMSLIHVLLDGNELTGTIPNTTGLVQSLEALRLDRNSLSGTVPSSISNLTSLSELNLANNKLTGPMPNLTGMNNLNSVDLSNNAFESAQAPDWLSTINSLNALVISSGGLSGQVPQKLFSLPQLEQVILDNNRFNGTLDMGSNISPQLQTMNLHNNEIISFTPNTDYNGTLILVGNPVCVTEIANSVYCQLEQKQMTPYSTSLEKCGSNPCPPDQNLSPHSCSCAYPYTGLMVFRAPSFRDVTNKTLFQQLETSLWTRLELSPNSVFLQDPVFNSDSYLELQVKLFPSLRMFFTPSEVLRIGFDLSNQTFKPPKKFGPYSFIASPYPFPSANGGGATKLSKGAVAGIAIGCVVLVIGLIVVGLYALQQKRRAERATEISKPFASWTTGGKETEGIPQVKGARWFSFDELRKSTNNFSDINEIGSGGYGKVYRGILPNGQMVAIKRAQQGSMQGGLEFKTEIELLSRVHHKNLVSLVGFCFEKKEQMLVYEFIPNGTLGDSLSGRSSTQLEWMRRLKIALGSAKGLAYLHELADPPIIHRDIKSTNILLDEKMNAKVADFGLSKLVQDATKGHISTQVKGTLGYLDPEYYMTQQLTEKSDVYSFGVVMLELITARKPIEKGKYIVREIRILLDDADDEFCGLKDIIDPVIKNSGRLPGFKRFVELAMQCVEEAAADRPTMNQLVKEFELMLQSEEIGANSSASSVAAGELGKVASGGGAAARQFYAEKKDVDGDAFKYSGGYTFNAKIEPK